MCDNDALMIDERREFQRLRLDPPLPGSLAATDVLIGEIGILGARVEPTAPFPVDRGELRFEYAGQPISMRCEIVRKTGDHAGVKFIAAVGESGDRLRKMLAELVNFELERRREATILARAPQFVDGDRTIRGSDAAYVTYRFEKNIWTRRRVFLPEQPAVGFTVARGEDVEEMTRLCRVYQASDEEGRRLIRLFAELSISRVLEIPPKA